MLKRTVSGIYHAPAAAVGPKPDDIHHSRPPHLMPLLTFAGLCGVPGGKG